MSFHSYNKAYGYLKNLCKYHCRRQLLLDMGERRDRRLDASTLSWVWMGQTNGGEGRRNINKWRDWCYGHLQIKSRHRVVVLSVWCQWCHRLDSTCNGLVVPQTVPILSRTVPSRRRRGKKGWDVENSCHQITITPPPPTSIVADNKMTHAERRCSCRRRKTYCYERTDGLLSCRWMLHQHRSGSRLPGYHS